MITISNKPQKVQMNEFWMPTSNKQMVKYIKSVARFKGFRWPDIVENPGSSSQEMKDLDLKVRWELW